MEHKRLQRKDSLVFPLNVSMKVKAYIHSLKDHEHNRHMLGEAEIIECIGDNRYLAEVTDRCGTHGNEAFKECRKANEIKRK